jgi:hypothetical protein
MAVDEDQDETTPLEVADPELRQLLGLFDAPAFARRGQDLEFSLNSLQARLRRQRSAMLDMLRLRLKQWAAAVEGPEAWRSVFAAPFAALWPLAEADDPVWALQVVPLRRRRAIARELVASVERFNRRWTLLVHNLNLEPINEAIDQYNRYYVLEKECSLGSFRLAARHFVPHTRLTREWLFDQYPLLPVPERLS